MEAPSQNSVADAVERAGGAIAVAKACGVSRQAADKWIRSGQLPRTEYTGETHYAESIAGLAKARGHVMDAAELRANASPKKSAA